MRENLQNGLMVLRRKLGPMKALILMELFAALYEQQNGAPLSPEQTGLLERLIREIWEEEEA